MDEAVSYTRTKLAWGVGLALCLALYFLVPGNFHRGLFIGFAAVFLIFLLIDSLFHQRLTVYKNALATGIKLSAGGIKL